jgi:hypothetical protein
MFRGIRRGGKVYNQTRVEEKQRKNQEKRIKDEEFGDVLFSIYWGHIDDFEKAEVWLEKGNDPNTYLEGYGTFFDVILNRETGGDNSIELIDLLLKFKANPYLRNIRRDNKEVSAHDLCVCLKNMFTTSENQEINTKIMNRFENCTL